MKKHTGYKRVKIYAKSLGPKYLESRNHLNRKLPKFKSSINCVGNWDLIVIIHKMNSL